MRFTNFTARMNTLARAEQAWSWVSCAPFAIGPGLCSRPNQVVQTQDRDENAGRRAPFQ